MGHFAERAPLCVIVRRGPSKYSQMILWHTDTDRFEPGQWVRGKVEQFTMTSDGKYAATEIWFGRSRLHSWEDLDFSVVCRPPYFTALKVWIGAHPYLRRSSTVLIAPGDVLVVRAGSESVHKMHAPNACPLETLELSDEELERTGWGYWHPWTIDASQGPARGTDQRGREILMEAGRVYEVVAGEPRLLFDCNEHSFRKVAPPEWATRW